MDEILRQVYTIAGDMWRRRWMGLAVTWLVAVIGGVVVWRIPDRYESSARVYVDTQTLLKPLMAGLAVQPNIDEQIGMLARTIIARPNIEKIMHNVNLDVSITSQIQRDQMVDDLTQPDQVHRRGRDKSTTSVIRTPTRSVPSAWCKICCRYSSNRGSVTSGATARLRAVLSTSR